MEFDCQKCGACCCNRDTNREAGLREYVEVGKRDALCLVPDLLASLGVQNEKGEWHLKLRDQRCVALRGRLGRQVSCAIYDLRPAACRRVVAGSPECLEARAERGIPG
jgi:Fe-S-cluster containining protein